MAAACSTCNTAAGPTIRVDVDTIRGPMTLVLTFEQAIDLTGRLQDWTAALAAEVPT